MDRDAPDHGSTKVGGKGSQGIQAFTTKRFYLLAPQRAHRGLSPTLPPGDEQGCAMDSDTPDHGSTKVGGKGSQGIQAFAREGFYPLSPQRVCGLSPTPGD